MCFHQVITDSSEEQAVHRPNMAHMTLGVVRLIYINFFYLIANTHKVGQWGLTTCTPLLYCRTIIHISESYQITLHQYYQ